LSEGLVVAHYGIEVAVRLPDGRCQRFAVGRRSAHVVGERVRVEGDRLRALPAQGVLRRRDRRGRLRAVAANLDLLGVVVAPVPASPQGFVDRALVGARAAGIAPLLVVNKCDLPETSDLVRSLTDLYAPGVPVLATSAVSGEGLDALRAVFAGAGDSGRRGAFIGTSGVGKSALANVLCPGLDLEVGEINSQTGLGRHVTTNATLHRLPSGGELVDTPGFRDFGPVEVSASELARHFPGFEELLAKACRFGDCLHRAEPDCRVTTALAEGRLEADRYEGYLALLAELEVREREDRGY
jgi:ribosome biogenesis GTPase